MIFDVDLGWMRLDYPAAGSLQHRDIEAEGRHSHEHIVLARSCLCQRFSIRNYYAETLNAFTRVSDCYWHVVA